MTWRWFIGMKFNHVRRRLARWIDPAPEATGMIITDNVVSTSSSAGVYIGRGNG